MLQFSEYFTIYIRQYLAEFLAFNYQITEVAKYCSITSGTDSCGKSQGFQ